MYKFNDMFIMEVMVKGGVIELLTYTNLPTYGYHKSRLCGSCIEKGLSNKVATD